MQTAPAKKAAEITLNMLTQIVVMVFFSVGDREWLSKEHLEPTHHQSQKVHTRCAGPFRTIVKELVRVYKLKLSGP